MDELIRAKQDADTAHLGELYTENRGLLWKLAKKYREACTRDRGVDIEDLVQCGFFGLIRAQEAFDPEAGKGWVGWAAWHIVREFNAALGIREGRFTRAHSGAVELDAPMPGDEDGDSARVDALADESLPDADGAMIEAERCAALHEALGRLSPDRAEAVRLHDLDGLTYELASEQMGVPEQRAHNLRAYALRDLARDWQLKKALDEETRFHANKGVNAFLSDWTSVTEGAAMWRIEREKAYEQKWMQRIEELAKG